MNSFLKFNLNSMRGESCEYIIISTFFHIFFRHFKPFDHRRMNPMAEIQEDPYSSNAGSCGATNPNPVNNPYGTTEPIYSSGRSSSASSASNSGSGGNNLIVQKSTQMPHMPSEVRHTNYQQRKPQMINPHILEHRDSANFSLASSSDSG